MLLYEIVYRQPAFIDQHHDADGRDWLGHRGDAEEGVLRHRRAAFQVLAADGLVAKNGVLPTDDRDRPGDVVAIDERLHRRFDVGRANWLTSNNNDDDGAQQ